MNDPCPICDRPIADTSYVCARCVDLLATDLRKTAASWHELEAVIARQTATVGILGATRRDTTPRGPTCRGMTCDHESCEAIWKARHRALSEPPLSHEDAPPANLSASEDAWIIRNTVTTWARHVCETRGIEFPGARPRVLQPVVVADPHDTDRPTRCHFSDLPVEQCACGRNHERMGA